jgi:hypothetical protein
MVGFATVRPAAAAGIALAFVMVGVGCGDDGDSTKKVGVALQEYKVIPDTGDVKAGKVKFETENVGGSTHEFVVVRAADAESLPTDADGAVDEEQIEEPNQIGEIEDIEPKAKESVTFDLDPGDYVLFCNIVDDSTEPAISHFQKGMSAPFTVSE